ncbi:L-serine ammonia-lyase, iron-sulfur-dependent subunit beta [Alicyclobacillus tolerans]|uniref:L-serine ammonia-lyase, iron-sulfur-dependent subunit beta n=1 Tax=Alicyclobacillus tolerans TaxID=90970 RepID=UPI001EFFC0D7|nr:L-serine ammonia-lyase, iron-sulfur-dependent subunit beta [Alicyclobacillus tolerans]MCF8567128.1 L-serine ammonia-lyase, iron-sulfur-dependent subunit beta [Alicyclobacillus tolerans]
MKYHSAFEIIGPVMVGPSSSHTAGPIRIGNIARQVLGEEPKQAVFELMGSFAETYRGHGTDLALLSGVLGMATDSAEVPTADAKARELGLDYAFKTVNLGFYHPNTVRIALAGATRSVKVVASSLGGGKIEVQELDDLPIKFSGENPTLILHHQDERGFLAKVSHLLDEAGYNIARLSLERWRRGGFAITLCEVDEAIGDDLLDALQASLPHLKDIRTVHVD